MASPTISSMTSFSGADLVVSFANQVIGELQGISWGIQREKAPVYTLGSSDPRSYSRGKRAIAGNMQFAVFDNDAVVSAMQHVWDRIAPKAMFTAAGNHAKRTAEDFSKVLDHIRWNITTSLSAMANFSTDGSNSNSAEAQSLSTAINTNISNNSNGGSVSYNYDYGFSGTSTIKPETQKGSNGGPKSYDSEFNYFVESWNEGDNIYVPAGFSPIRGENIVYADTLPPFDITMTWANEYGQTAFKKIYDVDILNVSSGASVDTIVMEEQMTYIARRISPLVRGVYSREADGEMKGISPTSAQ